MLFFLEADFSTARATPASHTNWPRTRSSAGEVALRELTFSLFLPSRCNRWPFLSYFFRASLSLAAGIAGRASALLFFGHL
jgi:hypothetical protein